MILKWFVFFCTIILLTLFESVPGDELLTNEASLTDQQNGLLKLVMNLLDKIETKDSIIESKDREIFDLQSKINELMRRDSILELYKKANADHITDLRGVIGYLKTTKINSEPTPSAVAESAYIMNQESQHSKSSIGSNNVEVQKIENQSEKNKDAIRMKDEHITNLISLYGNQGKLENLQKPSFEDLPESCDQFANSSEVRKIKVPGLNPFDVLCASATGPGWIVIQQRINGKEDFYRDWATYRAGFGSFDGDFFLGLENIYRLTTNRPHELYIHLEGFNGEVVYAAYEYFSIVGEDDQYRLVNIDGFSGNSTNDNMKYHKGNKFYTFDRDNSNKCAKQRLGGWWYDNCAASNLNGKYFDYKVEDVTANYWHDFTSLKTVRILIRQKLI